MKIFITGSHGFIGSRLVPEIISRIKGVVIQEYDLAYGQDICNEFQISKAIEMFQPDIVIHMAALAGVRRGENYPKEYYMTNVLGTQNVFNSAKNAGVEKIISFSSSSVFGKQGYPISVYGISKLAGEHIAKMSDIKSVSVVRPFTVYGENGREDQIIKKWINNILKEKPVDMYGDGTSYRNYTYVGDLVDAICKMIKSKKTGFIEYDIAGSEKITLNNVYEIFSEYCSHNGIPFNANVLRKNSADPDGTDISTSRAWFDLDWSPKTDFKDKIKKILKKELLIPWKNKK